MHSREVKQRGVAMKCVYQIGEALQRNGIVLAVELLQRGVNFENVGKRACTLQSQLLV